MTWEPPADLDPEVLSLCEAMNAYPGIFTTSSCCGHGKQPFKIFFGAKSLDNLPLLLFWFDACHSGEYGWRVSVYTDCAASPATFVVEGPAGGYASADAIAKFMREDLAPAPAVVKGGAE